MNDFRSVSFLLTRNHAEREREREKERERERERETETETESTTTTMMIIMMIMTMTKTSFPGRFPRITITITTAATTKRTVRCDRYNRSENR